VVDVSDSLNSYTAQLPAELESVVAARHMVEAAARSWEMDDSVCDDSALAVSELTSNSVLHAGSSVSVCVRRMGRGLRIEVTDANDHLPVVDAERPEDLLANRSMTGRGLAMVAATADRWGADPLPGGGKVTWAELGTGRRLVSREPSPAFPPEPKPLKLSDSARAAGVTSAVAVTGGGHKVQLIGVPVQLVVESARHFSDLEREIRVMAMDRNGPEELKGVFAAGRQISARVGPWRRVDRELVAAAAARGDDRLDYEIEVPVDAADLVERVTSLVQRLRSSIFRRHLLTGLPSAEVIEYQRWYREEVLAQLAGRAPVPCPLAVPGA
jgi:anti-sigma regulatory factor (Ser/Thr protein kinase)